MNKHIFFYRLKTERECVVLYMCVYIARLWRHVAWIVLNATLRTSLDFQVRRNEILSHSHFVGLFLLPITLFFVLLCFLNKQTLTHTNTFKLKIDSNIDHAPLDTFVLIWRLNILVFWSQLKNWNGKIQRSFFHWISISIDESGWCHSVANAHETHLAHCKLSNRFIYSLFRMDLA